MEVKHFKFISSLSSCLSCVPGTGTFLFQYCSSRYVVQKKLPGNPRFSNRPPWPLAAIIRELNQGRIPISFAPGFSLPMARQGIGPGQARRSSARKEQPAQVLVKLVNWKLAMWNWQAAVVVLQMGYNLIITLAGYSITQCVLYLQELLLLWDVQKHLLPCLTVTSTWDLAKLLQQFHWQGSQGGWQVCHSLLDHSKVAGV